MPTPCLSLCICRQPVSRLCLLWWDTFSNSLTWRIQKVFTLRCTGSTSSWRKQDTSSGIWKQPSTVVITWLLHMIMNDFLPNLYLFEHACRLLCIWLPVYLCCVNWSSWVLQCTDDSQCGWENHCRVWSMYVLYVSWGSLSSAIDVFMLGGIYIHHAVLSI